MSSPAIDILSTAEFDLSLTLESGQFFRWTREGDVFVIRSRDRRVRIRQAETGLEVDGASPDWVRRFLALDVPLHRLREAVRGDAVAAALLDRLAGLRVIRQDPWQCLLSYICATFSNIGRITKNVEDLARLFGRIVPAEPLAPCPLPLALRGARGEGQGAKGRGAKGRGAKGQRAGGEGPSTGGAALPADGVWHAFPRPGAFNDRRLLAQVRLGYRAKYLWEAARTVTEPWLEGLRTKPYAEAKAALCGVPGVGDKVADCVLLFSLGFGEAFPVDVWVRRFVRRHYPGTRRLTDRRIGAWARRRYGQWAGWVQQYFFTAARNGVASD